VDLITGPENTNVTVTVQRGEEDIDFELTRAVIPIHSEKGWKRVDADETSWDWFIDRDNGIGYVRLLQFTDETTRDLTRAVREMEQQGLNGLILDLRFNPGGLLTEAVSVASVFVDKGRIVSTEGTMPGEVLDANGRSMLNGIPVAVLINEGSASASEIVSGAIRHYADTGQIPAIIVGARSFGKGSVQNVWPLGRGNAMLKLTTQYYKLPDGRILHRKPGSETWGVEPHVVVKILPEQITEALTLRQEADVLPINEQGEVVQGDEPAPDPERLLTEGLDLQLQTALMLLQTKAVAQEVGPQAALPQEAERLPG
jgi:carboxyl-terminal processing protease